MLLRRRLFLKQPVVRSTLLCSCRSFTTTTTAPMRVVFFGTCTFSLGVLDALNKNFKQGGIVSQLDVICKGKVRLKKKKYEIPPVIDYANRHNLNQLSWDQVKVDRSFEKDYDLGVVASFGDFIPGALISTLKRGAINFHPSLLPRWRGPAPVIHTILAGDLVTGVSVIEVSPKKFDVGKVLYQEQHDVPEKCTSAELLSHLSLKSGELVPHVLRNLEHLQKNAQTQDERCATHAPKVDKSSGNIDFDNHTASYVERLQRALPPPMGVWVSLGGQRVRLGEIVDIQETNDSRDNGFSPMIANDSHSNNDSHNNGYPPGYCWYDKKRLWIQLASGCIAVKSLRFERASREMSAKHFRSSKLVDSSGSPVERVFTSVDDLTATDFITMTKTEKSVHDLWLVSDAVCFDVDSTLCTTEMIDELAAFCNVGDQVAEWTRKAMGEGISFREALDARLNIIKPTKNILEQFKAKDIAVLTPGVEELITKLVALKKDIFLVSGGFQSLIKPIAERIGVSEDNIFANRILFDEAGEYAGFDTDQPTSASGGKKVVMETLKKRFGYKTLVMIGDGMSDFEAYPTADLFIGFGGNVVRENVRAKALWFVMDFKELVDCLPK